MYEKYGCAIKICHEHVVLYVYDRDLFRKKRIKRTKIMETCRFSPPAQREGFDLQMCVFLEVLVRVNELVFVFPEWFPPNTTTLPDCNRK